MLRSRLLYKIKIINRVEGRDILSRVKIVVTTPHTLILVYRLHRTYAIKE